MSRINVVCMLLWQLVLLAPTASQNTLPAEASTGLVPTYHLAMLNDVTRNDAFYRALKKHVTPDSVVVDVGAGSGLLSLMAASLGAKRVYSVERRQQLCSQVLTEIVRRNGFESVVIPLCGDAQQVTANDLVEDGQDAFADPDTVTRPTILVVTLAAMPFLPALTTRLLTRVVVSLFLGGDAG
jgi:predicted nicotinamide N-methyase